MTTIYVNNNITDDELIMICNAIDDEIYNTQLQQSFDKSMTITCLSDDSDSSDDEYDNYD